MEELQNIWNIVHENSIVLYNVFAPFMGLNNNTIIYGQYPIQQKMPVQNIGSTHPYF